MDPRDSKIVEFLETVLTDHNEKLRDACKVLIEDLPPGSEFVPSSVLIQAKLRLEESDLQELAAMNATAFDSARDE